MKNYVITLFVLSLSVIYIHPINAASQVKLIEGKKFIDYELTNQTRKRSLVTLEKDFNRVFSKLSTKYLKNGQSITIDVTNLDLAGDIRFNIGSANQNIRVIKEISPIKLYFKYKVVAADGSLVKEGEYKIKEFLSISSNINRLKNRGNLGHFMPYLEKWFKAEFTASS